MLVLAAICAVAHTPHFAGGKHHVVDGEPSAAIYCHGPKTLHIRYKAGNFIHVAILEPQRLGASAVGVLGSVSQNFSCRLGAPASSDHASNRTAGSLVYEPFGESDLRVVVVVATGHQSDSDQTCTLVVSADAPYVVAVGTQEEFWLAYFVGLSWYVMRVSAWVGNYAYGYALIATLAVAGLACRATRGRQAAAVAIALFAATALSRLAQLAVTGYGWGMWFAAWPLLLAVLMAVAGQFQSSRIAAAVAVLSVLVPIRMLYFEALACVAAAVLFNRDNAVTAAPAPT